MDKNERKNARAAYEAVKRARKAWKALPESVRTSGHGDAIRAELMAAGDALSRVVLSGVPDPSEPEDVDDVMDEYRVNRGIVWMQ